MKIIIPILVGSAIGYFTNWLAIKMLFRPLEEKKILGFKVPFTPGLIPKERKRMAKSVGEAVGMHLLTPEKIAEVVSSDETKLKMRSFIRSKVHSLKGKDKSLEDVFKGMDSENYNFFLDTAGEKIYDLLIRGLKDESLRADLIAFLEKDIYEKYKDEALDGVLKASHMVLDGIGTSRDLEWLFINTIEANLISLKTSDKDLKEIISKDSIKQLGKIIDDNKSNIMDRLRELYYKPHMQKRLKLSIEDLVEQNVSKMITMFIEPSIISDKVFVAIEKYVDSDQAEEVAGFVLTDLLYSLSNTKVSSLAGYLDQVIRREDISDLYGKILEGFLEDENKEKILDILAENIRSKDQIIKKKLLESGEKMLEAALASDGFNSIIKNLIGTNIEKLVHLPISKLLKDIDDGVLERLMEVSDKVFNTMLKEELYNVISLFDVSKIVEDEINSFEVEYAEELILDIADRELKAITRLGALLGAIMGLLMPFLQMI